VILFGSAARGELTRDSDLDFLVIEPEVENPALESVRLRRVLGDLVLAADVIVASEHRVKEWRDVGGEPDPRGAGRGQGAGGLMASKQDLAEQLLRRADTDAAGARAMLPINEVADVLVCFLALC
jgi:hypothetical protein